MSSLFDKRSIHHVKKLNLLPLTLLLSGCQLETVYGASENKWLWIVIPLAGFVVVGSMLIWMSRERQLRQWDLAISPSDPSVKKILLWTVGVAGALALVFIVQNFFFNIDGTQKLVNVGLWLLGSLGGVAIALYIGLNMAEPKPV